MRFQRSESFQQSLFARAPNISRSLPGLNDRKTNTRAQFLQDKSTALAHVLADAFIFLVGDSSQIVHQARPSDWRLWCPAWSLRHDHRTASTYAGLNGTLARRTVLPRRHPWPTPAPESEGWARC